MRAICFILLLSLAAPGVPAAPRIVVSVKPIHMLTTAIMNGVGAPDLLIGKGQSPHEYLVKPSSARLIQDAELIIWIGPALESGLARSIDTLAGDGQSLALIETDLPTLHSVRRSGRTAEGEHTRARSIDPHVWLAPNNAEAIAVTIAERLKRLDPRNAHRYETNARALIESIQNKDRELATRLDGYKEQRYLSLHDSFQYFERYYGLNSAGTLSGDTHHSPGAKRIATLREMLAGGNIACVLHEPLSTGGLLKILLEGNDTPDVTADPLGWQSEAAGDGYTAMLEMLAVDFERCFSGDKPAM